MRRDVSKGSDEDNTGLFVHVRSSSRNSSTQPWESSPVISSWQSQTNYLQFHLSKSFGNVSCVKRVGLTGGFSKALGSSQVRKVVGHWPWLNSSPSPLVHMSESHGVPVCDWQGLGSALSHSWRTQSCRCGQGEEAVCTLWESPGGMSTHFPEPTFLLAKEGSSHPRAQHGWRCSDGQCPVLFGALCCSGHELSYTSLL